jgi:hypothetical protein
MPEVSVEGDTGRAVVSPAARTLRDENAMSGRRLLAASGQIPMAADTSHGRAFRIAAGCRTKHNGFS